MQPTSLVRFLPARSFRPVAAAALILAIGPAVRGQAPPAAPSKDGVAPGREAIPPREVRVLPYFFVPLGEAAPTDAQSKKLMRHLEWARTRFREMLGGRDTFAVAEPKPRVYRADRPLAFYRSRDEASGPQVVSELLREVRHTRYSCPYVLLVVMMNPRDDFPTGGGRPINGGYNTGGGLVVLSSFALDRIPNFQSTLQHEIAHSFGLPHVDVYGYSMRDNDSIMSYNQRHHTRNFAPSPTPGKLIPEDLRGLALNRRAFPKLRLDPARDVPAGYALAERVVPLGPMDIPDQPTVRVSTGSGEDYGSKVGNIVQNEIRPNVNTGKVTFDPKTMWSSAKGKTDRVAVELTFPYEVELTRIAVHSQHSGRYHPAKAVSVSVGDGGGRYRPVASAEGISPDAVVDVPKAKGKTWRLEFRTDETRCVVIRGLRFFAGEDEVFPTLVPGQP
jgi:hypothetical protein